MTKEEQIEMCYQQFRYSQAFAQPIGYLGFKYGDDAPKARAFEDYLNKRAKKVWDSTIKKRKKKAGKKGAK